MAYQCSGVWALVEPAPPLQPVCVSQPQITAGADAEGSSGTAPVVPAHPLQLSQRCIQHDNGMVADAAAHGERLHEQCHYSSQDAAAAMSQDGQEVRNITFLYKLREGAAGASFGLNVAMLAGVPRTIVTRAAAVASAMGHSQSGGAANELTSETKQPELADGCDVKRDPLREAVNILRQKVWCCQDVQTWVDRLSRQV
jgi:hypothetical protein